MNSYIKYIVPISLSAFLVACGSGGSKGNSHQPSQPTKEQAQPSAPILNKPNEEKVVAPTPPAKEQVQPSAPMLNKPNEEKVVAPTQPSKEQVQPSAPILNKPNEEKIIVPTPLAKLAKEQEQLSVPMLNKPNEEKVVVPTPLAKEQEQSSAPILNTPSEEKVVVPTQPSKEQEQPTTPAVNQPSEEVAIDLASPIKTPEKPNAPLDIPAEINTLANTWFAGGNSEYSKNGVRVYKLIENDRNFADDPNFKEKKLEYIQLKLGTNSTSDYTLTLLDDNVYYGFYRDSIDMFKVNNQYVYSFNEKSENKGDLSQLSATYRGHFVYSLRSNPNLATTSDVHLTYTKGHAEGKIYSRQAQKGEQGRELFDIKANNGDLRLLELNPLVKDLDNSVYGDELVVRKNSPDRIIIETHFINGQDGTPNKHLVGKGGNEKYWGVLGAGKVEK